MGRGPVFYDCLVEVEAHDPPCAASRLPPRGDTPLDRRSRIFGCAHPSLAVGFVGFLAGPAVAAHGASEPVARPRTPDLGYYWQSVTGHLKLMHAARPVDDWLADPDTPPHRCKQRLALAQRIRRFAVSELGLPDNASYQRYADLQRRAAVYNVVAAPELSLTLQTWCFPVAGCVGYRGYFDEPRRKAFSPTARRRHWTWRSTRSGLLDPGLDELGRRRPAAQHLHRLPRRRARPACCFTSWHTRSCMPAERHHLQRIVRHGGRTASASPAGWPGPTDQARDRPTQRSTTAAGLQRPHALATRRAAAG